MFISLRINIRLKLLPWNKKLLGNLITDDKNRKTFQDNFFFLVLVMKIIYLSRNT